MRKTLHRLFFTKDDELDLGWLILLACCAFGLLAVALDSSGVWDISIAAWSWFGSFTALSFIAGTTLSKARLIAADTPSALARTLASVAPRPPSERDAAGA
jgi:hypothetical protein